MRAGFKSGREHRQWQSSELEAAGKKSPPENIHGRPPLDAIPPGDRI